MAHPAPAGGGARTAAAGAAAVGGPRRIRPIAMRPRPEVLLSGPGAVAIAEIAGAVPDPELPMVSLANLGVLRAVAVDSETGEVAVTITPTYTGCPAMDTMAADIVSRLREAGYGQVTVHKVLGGDWSSDHLTEAARSALAAAGIAPPASSAGASLAGESPSRDRAAEICCPLCGSPDTEQLTRFGATSCKALYRCLTCREPFEYFKVH